MRTPRFLLAAMTAALGFAAGASDNPKGPAPPAEETLTYLVNWPSGLSLGEAQMHSKLAQSQWNFSLTLDAAIPGFSIKDRFTSVANEDFCSRKFTKEFAHGKKTANERLTFDPQAGTALRETMPEGPGQGRTDLSISGCARDALTYLYFLRHELAQGRVPSSQTVYYGAAYTVKVEYGGAQQIRVNDYKVEADRMKVSFKGPASEMSFEMFITHDPARTPVMIRAPFALGTFSMELVK